MANNTSIEWCDVSVNPVTGCDGTCHFCYARKMAERLKGRYGYPLENPFRPGVFHPDKLGPIAGRGKRVFVCSMGDLFHDKVEHQHIVDVFDWAAREAIEREHIMLFLTRRPTNMFLAAAHWQRRSGVSLDQFWFGTSCSTVAELRNIGILSTMARSMNVNSFVSFEPLLEDVGRKVPVQIWNDIDWVIAGPETGQNAKHCKWEWIERLRDRAREYRIPFFLKRSPDTSRSNFDINNWREFPK